MKSFREFIAEASIGKRMGDDLYVHKAYSHVLPQDELNSAVNTLKKNHGNFDYTAIKYNRKSKAFSFIKSPDFDTAHEPTVGDSVKVHPDGTSKLTKMSKDPKIWHHKWQWVGPDYTGFDVGKSKKRSAKWKAVVGVNRAVSSRIGSKSYWDTNVVPLLKEGKDIPDVGININNDDMPYADLIVDGKKKYESRVKPTLNRFVGQTVGIVRTSKKGKAKAIGHVTVGEPIKVDYEQFDAMRDHHLVPAGSPFDCKKDGHKWLYPMQNPKRWDEEKEVENKGFVIIARKIKKDLKESPEETVLSWQDFKKHLHKQPYRDAFGEVDDQEKSHWAAAADTWHLRAVDPNTFEPVEHKPKNKRPVIIAPDGDVLDGRHRIARAIDNGHKSVLAWVGKFDV